MNAHLGATVPVAHERVLEARTAAAVLTAIAAIAALGRGVRRSHANVTMGVLLVAPIVLLGGQSYGGEAILRVFLFSLGPACILIAGLLEPLPARNVAARTSTGVATTRWHRLKQGRGGTTRLAGPVAVTLLGLFLLASFPLTRWGNESFEAIAPTDLEATQWVMAHVPKGSTLVEAEIAPIVYSHIENFHYADISLLVALRGTALVAAIRKLDPDPWVLVTRYEREYGIVSEGYPQDWLSVLKSSLLGTGEVVQRYGNATSAVLQILPVGVTLEGPHSH